MTFDEIVVEIKDRLNITSADATTRIGRAVNVMYRRVTSSLGIEVARRVTGVVGNTAFGSQNVTFTGIEKIERVIDDTTGSIREVTEHTFEELRSINPSTSSTAKMWAVEKMGPSSVTVRLDILAQTVFGLKADGLQTATTLSGSQVPAFNQDFHDVLVEGVIADELRKQEKLLLAKEAKSVYEARLAELRFFLAKSGGLSIRQGGAQSNASSGVSGGGGSAPSGGTSWTQTGLVTFDRGANAPFAIDSGAAVVPNLDADKVDGYHAVDLPALSQDNAGNILAQQVFS